MTALDLLTLALRVIGFWVLLSTVESTALAVAMLSTGPGVRTGLVVELGAVAFSRAALAAFLLLFAPAIASRFYRDVLGTPLPIDPKQGYELAARILGLFSLISAIHPASTIGTRLFEPGFLDELLSPGSWYWAYLIEAVSYVLLGVLLVGWAPRIVAPFARRGAANQHRHKQVAYERAEASSIGPRDVHGIAASTLGVFSLMSAIRPISNITAVAFAPHTWKDFSSSLVEWTVEATLYIVCGVILLLKAPKVAALLADPRESNPNTTPERPD